MLKLIFSFFSTFFLGYYEFSNSREVSPLPLDILFFYLTFIVFVLFTLYHLIKVFRKASSEEKKSTKYILIYNSLFLFIFVIHHFIREYSDESESLVVVEQSKKIEGRESTIFDFKKNGDLKISAYFKFGEAYYWGAYKKYGDTLLLNISPDFNIGKKAYFKSDKFSFLDDTLNNYTLQIIEHNYR